MNNDKKLSKGMELLKWAAVFLTLFGIVIAIIYAGGRVPALRKILVFIGYAIVIFYGVYAYRQPHGNLLRYVIVVFAFLLVMENYSTAASPVYNEQNRGIEILLTGSAAVSAAYIGGRLNKVRTNRVPYAFVLILLFLRCGFASGDSEIISLELADAVLWMVIGISYFLRYTLHRDATSEVL